MKRILYSATLFALCVFCSCKNSNDRNNMDDNFNLFKQRFIDKLWELNPAWATGMGYHKFDDVLEIPTQANMANRVKALNALNDSLKTFPVDSLSPENKIDWKLMDNYCRATSFYFNEFKAWQWNPAQYNVGETFELVMNRHDVKVDRKLELVQKKLADVKKYFDAARANISNPTPEHTQLAIDQNLGSLSVFSSISDSVNKSMLNEDRKTTIHHLLDGAKAEVTAYADWLRDSIQPALKKSVGKDFRIGKELYDKMFGFEIMSHYSPEEIFEKAKIHKKELHQKMAELAHELWPKYLANEKMPADTLVMIKKVIDKISEQHCKPEDFQKTIEAQLSQLSKFIKEKDLITLDPNKPLKVRPTPEYMAGTAGASINAPGPYDRDAETFYNVGSLSGETKEKAESWLREYNDYILQILNIHEAIPGHYTQLVYSNQSPSLVKSIFQNNTMIEGWAVYGERMMLEEGYGNNAPEMWLMYYKWNLRSTLNTILDYSIQVLNMQKEDALQLMLHEGFQQEAEANGKWKRATLSQTQLMCYFTGFTEIYDLREEMKKKLGKSFSLKQFHEKFLSFGSSPVKFIREIMLAN